MILELILSRPFKDERDVRQFMSLVAEHHAEPGHTHYTRHKTISNATSHQSTPSGKFLYAVVYSLKDVQRFYSRLSEEQFELVDSKIIIESSQSSSQKSP